VPTVFNVSVLIIPPPPPPPPQLAVEESRDLPPAPPLAWTSELEPASMVHEERLIDPPDPPPPPELPLWNEV